MRRIITAIIFFMVLTGLPLSGCAKRPEPTLSVTIQQSGKDLVIRMQTTNFKIGTDGHVHLRMDDGPVVMPMTEEYTLPNAPPGKHAIWVELSNISHVSLGVEQTVQVEVK